MPGRRRRKRQRSGDAAGQGMKAGSRPTHRALGGAWGRPGAAWVSTETTTTSYRKAPRLKRGVLRDSERSAHVQRQHASEWLTNFGERRGRVKGLARRAYVPSMT